MAWESTGGYWEIVHEFDINPRRKWFRTDEPCGECGMVAKNLECGG